MMALCTEIIGVVPVKSRLHQNVDTFNVNRKQMLTNDAMSKQVNLLMLLTPLSPLFNHKILFYPQYLANHSQILFML